MNLSLASFLHTLQGGTAYALKAIEDGTDWVQASVAKIAQKADSSFQYLRMNEGNAIQATLYDSFGNPIALPVGVSDAGLWVSERLKETGGSPSLLVDGSTTAVPFTYVADADDDIALNAVVLVIVSNSLVFGADDFGAINTLTNGVKLSVKSNGNEGDLLLVNQNEDFLHSATPGGFNLDISSKDTISCFISLGGGIVLKAGTDDNVTITIQDDLSSAGDYFQASVQGVKQS